MATADVQRLGEKIAGCLVCGIPGGENANVEPSPPANALRGVSESSSIGAENKYSCVVASGTCAVSFSKSSRLLVL